MEDYRRPSCANCGDAIDTCDAATLVTCGHAFHLECWLIHSYKSQVKHIPCTCPSCKEALRR